MLQQKLNIYFRILFLIFLATSVIITQAQESTPETSDVKTIEYIVIADTANLRSGPGTNFSAVGRVANGESLLIYDESPETSGWLRVYREEEEDSYIADFLVERAPMRFYPIDQEPLLEVSGRGKDITEVFEIPRGAYRIDVTAEDNAFILKTVIVEGECRDSVIFNEISFGTSRMTMSGLLVSQGCSIIFETDNVDGNWEFEIRDIIVDVEFLTNNILTIETGTIISGNGRALTMATLLPEGVWTITAKVEDNAFILRPQVLNGDCDTGSVFNELVRGSEILDVATVYRSPEDGCIIFWETSNVDQLWEIGFEKLR